MKDSTTVKTIFSKAEELEGQELTVQGWVRTIRDSRAIGFIELHDGSHFSSIQIVLEEDKLDNYADIVRLNVGSALTVTGNLILTPNQKQPFELNANSITIEGKSTPDYPLQKKRHSMEFLREIAHLRPRTNTYQAAFRVRSIVSHALHRFFEENGFIWVHTPIITGSDAEGAGEMFRVTTLDPKDPPLTQEGQVDFSQDFFQKETHLTVSGQLQGEAFASAFDKIYTFGPTFRAENSHTPRHAAEFWMLEPEMAFSDLDDIKVLGQDMVQYVIKDLLEKCPEEMEFFNRFFDDTLLERLELVASAKFGSITYTDAIKELEQAIADGKVEFEYPVYWGCDLATEHERYLAEQIFQKPVYVTDYPKEIKAFYMRLNDDGKTVAATDLLVPGIGEMIGGSQREERLEVLEQRIEEMDMDPSDYQWFLDLRRYGTHKHAGFGLGFDRFLMYVTGIQNIRDVIPFPRTTGSARF